MALKIKAFREDEKPCYEGKSCFGHIWWDICDCDACKEVVIYDDDQPRRRKKKLSQQHLKERYEASDPEVDLLGESSGKFHFYVSYPRTRKKQKTKKTKKQNNPNSLQIKNPSPDTMLTKSPNHH